MLLPDKPTADIAYCRPGSTRHHGTGLGCRLTHVLAVIARTASCLDDPVGHCRYGEISDDADNQEGDVNTVRTVRYECRVGQLLNVLLSVCAAGVLSALREGRPMDQAVRRGCAVGAIQVMSRGDNDGLPTREELDAFMTGEKDWRRHSA